MDNAGPKSQHHIRALPLCKQESASDSVGKLRPAGPLLVLQFPFMLPIKSEVFLFALIPSIESFYLYNWQKYVPLVSELLPDINLIWDLEYHKERYIKYSVDFPCIYFLWGEQIIIIIIICHCLIFYTIFKNDMGFMSLIYVQERNENILRFRNQ